MLWVSRHRLSDGRSGGGKETAADRSDETRTHGAIPSGSPCSDRCVCERVDAEASLVVRSGTRTWLGSTQQSRRGPLPPVVLEAPRPTASAASDSQTVASLLPNPHAKMRAVILLANLNPITLVTESTSHTTSVNLARRVISNNHQRSNL